MTAPVYQPQSYTDFQGLSKLRTEARDDSQAAIRTVAEQFESIFIGMMMKSMRDASIGDQLFDSNAQNTYLEMYDKELSISLASQGGIGLADTIVRQLSPSSSNTVTMQEGDEKRPFNPAEYTIYPPMTMPRAVPNKVDQPDATAGFDSPEQFIEELWPLAQQAAAQLGVDPKVLLSQAALETGWGSRVIQNSDGSSSYNLFNIKADGRWSGAQTTVSTLEYEGVIPVRQQANFRAYDSYEESFKDYVNFITQSPRYGEALVKAHDAEGYVDALQQGGYATDPDYADKIKDIMQRNLFVKNDV